MRIHGALAWFALVLLASIGNGQAANVTVTANPNLTFTPASVTINAGDTVTFKNVGSVPHNVVANDNSFTSGAVTTGWTFNQTFNTPGTFGYYCALHGAPNAGMSGSVIVNAVAPPPPPPPPSITIGGYMSGNWYNVNQGGSGFQIEAATNNNMIAIWFVYSPDGTQQNWIYAQGAYDTTSNTVTLPAELLTGAKFPPNFNPADVHQLNGANWGTLTFIFSDCNTGTASWHSDFAGYNGQNDTPMAITRLTQIDGTTCPQ